MATGTAESLLDKISQGHLKCYMCAERYKEPKILDCQHSFCWKCLQKEKEKLGVHPQVLACPLCNKKTSLTGKNFADLPTDEKLTALLDEVDKYVMQLERPKQIFKCDKHNQGLNSYCDTCKKLECTTCIVLNVDQGHTCTNHTLLGLPEALNKYKQELAQLVPKVQRKIVELSSDMEEAAKSYKKFTAKVEETNQTISQKADSEVARIRAEEKKLKEDAAWFYHDRVEAIKTADTTNATSVTQAEQKLSEVEQLMAQESSYEVLPLIEKPLRDLKKLTEVNVLARI